jgi:transcriptional regulator with XRE-family HTH domain
MPPATGSTAPDARDVVRQARLDAGLAVRELARRAGISHTQISRLEAGQVAKPSREVLVAIARALDRNPNPLLILAGHLHGDSARDSLKTLFREGSELAEIWSGCSDIPLQHVQAVARADHGDERDVKAIAADVFRVQESDETLWDDSYELAAASGMHAEQLRELMDIWRYVGPDLRTRWLEYGRQLRRIADLDYLTAAKAEELAAQLTRKEPS